MKLTENTVLITGGASGIGLALAARFMRAGNKVIIVGRREEKLKEAQDLYPGLHVKVCDISSEEERTALCKWVLKEFPQINVLVNNAGIQQRINLLKPAKEWAYYHKEIAINVEGPIHLALLLIPHLKEQAHAAIVNVSSGLALRPGVWVPIYSATKAAMHSFTKSLRLQLAETAIDVVEVLPPAVNTDLGGAGIHSTGAPLGDFADSVFERLGLGIPEIGYNDSEKRLTATKEELDKGMKEAWEKFFRDNPNF